MRSLEQSTFVLGNTYDPNAINKVAPDNSAMRSSGDEIQLGDCFADRNRRYVHIELDLSDRPEDEVKCLRVD